MHSHKHVFPADSVRAPRSKKPPVPPPYPSRYPPLMRKPTGYERDVVEESLEPVPVLGMEVIHVINIVTTFFLGMRINVKAAARRHPCHIRFLTTLVAGMGSLRRPRLTCLIFNTGIVLVNGAKYEIQAVLAAWQCCRVLRMCGIREVSVNDLRTENVTYTAKIGNAFNLLTYFADHPSTCRYTPENFPVLTQRSKTNSLTINFFHSGKIVVTGAKAVIEGVDTFEGRLPVIRRYTLSDPADIARLKAEIDRLTNEGKRLKRQILAEIAAEDARLEELGLPVPSKRARAAAAKAKAAATQAAKTKTPAPKRKGVESTDEGESGYDADAPTDATDMEFGY